MRQVLKLDSGRALEYDKTNQLHLAAVAMGARQLERCPVAVIRNPGSSALIIWLIDPALRPNNMYPLVPFWGYRKDRTGEPYGLIVRAMPAQDEVNLQRIKLTFLLQAKRVIMDKDATNMSRDQVLEQVERPDGYIELNPTPRQQDQCGRCLQGGAGLQRGGPAVPSDAGLGEADPGHHGVYAAFLGQGSTGQSGVAISNLVEQGATTLSEINDNYRMGCQQVGQLALAYLLEDMASKRNYKVTVNRDDPAAVKPPVVVNVEQEGRQAHQRCDPAAGTYRPGTDPANRRLQATAGRTDDPGYGPVTARSCSSML